MTLTGSEPQLLEQDRKPSGTLYERVFREMGDRIAAGMESAAREDGFRFLDLRSVFDSGSVQTLRISRISRRTGAG